MTLRNKFILSSAVLALSLVIAGCGDGSGGAPMPDNNQVRKENPINERPSLSASGGSGGASPNTQLGKE